MAMAQPVARGISRESLIWRVLALVYGVGSFVLLILILLQFVLQVTRPLPAQRLILVQDVALPAALPARFLSQLASIPTHVDLLAPGVAVRFDHFDFQALDPRSGLLFIAHTGPSPDKAALSDPLFNPDKDSQFDGHVLVFDTRQKKLKARIDIAQITGMVAAPDIGRVFAVSANDNRVYVIDEHTLKSTAIPLGATSNPDSIDYDARDHFVTISERGIPHPSNSDPRTQNIALIDLRTHKVSRINLGLLPPLAGEHPELAHWGYSIGHNHYDPVLRRLFVPIQQLTDQSSVNPPLPPGGTSELIAIDPLAKKITARLALPRTCGMPHGMGLDMRQHIAFIACTEVDPEQQLIQNVVRVDLRTMHVMLDPLLLLPLKPDIVAVDRPLGILYVGCTMGVAVFDIHDRTIRKLGYYVFGKNTHTIAVNEVTHDLYLPLPDAGGRPTLRIVRYDPNGV